MRKRNRGALFSAVTVIAMVAIAVFVTLSIWDLSASQTENRVRAERYAAGYAQEANDRIASDCGVASGTPIVDCIAQVLQSQREQERGEYDLAAQRDMAQWAFAVVVLSLCSMTLTTVGIVYVARTLKATRKANKIANRVAQRQMRAYVHVEMPTTGGANINLDKISAAVVVKNYGLTPARNVSTFLDTALTVMEPTSEYFSEIVERQKSAILQERDLTIGPTASVQSGTEPRFTFGPQLEPVMQLVSGVGFIVVFGRVGYMDVFLRNRQTSFLHVYKYQSGKWVGSYHRVGNYAT